MAVMLLPREFRFLITIAALLAAASGNGAAQQAGFPPAGMAQQPPPAPNDPSNPRNYQNTIVPSLLDMGSGIDQGNTGPFVTLDDRQFARIVSERCLMQVELGQLAGEKNVSDGVRLLKARIC